MIYDRCVLLAKFNKQARVCEKIAMLLGTVTFPRDDSLPAEKAIISYTL